MKRVLVIWWMGVSPLLSFIKFKVELSVESLYFVNKKGYEIVGIRDERAIFMNEYGHPMLPLLHYKFCVPTDMEIENYSIEYKDSIVLQGEYLIYPAQKPYHLDSVFTPPDSLIYNSNALFPQEIVKFSSDFCKKKNI